MGYRGAEVSDAGGEQQTIAGDLGDLGRVVVPYRFFFPIP